MRVLLLAPHPFYQERGTPIAVDMLLRALSERGDEVDVLTFPDGADRDYPGIRIYRIPGLRGSGPGFSLRKLVNDVVMTGSVFRRLRRHRYDVIHAVEESAFIARAAHRWFKTPFVFDMDSVLSHQLVEKFAWLSPLDPVFRRLEAWVIRDAGAVAPMCEAVADVAREFGAGNVHLLKDVSLVGSGGYSGEVKDLREGLPPDALLSLYVGNLVSYQGIDLMLEALAIARREDSRLHLAVVGGQPEHIARYSRLAAELGLGSCCRFAGPRPLAMIGELMGQADMLLSPRTLGANTPMKIYSYLDSGVPVVATDMPTHTQVLDETIAALAAPDPESFAKAMIALAADPELRSRLGAAARRHVSLNHSYASFKTAVDDLYDALGAH